VISVTFKDFSQTSTEK